MGMFSALTAQERVRLASMLLSASGELIEEKMRLRRCADARGLYGTDVDAYVGTIDDVHGVLQDLLARDLTGAIAAMDPAGQGRTFVPERGDLIREMPAFAPTGTGWPVAS